jgi:hypothetical protein
MTATKKRVGRDGFTGSPITDWCPPCEDFVVRLRNGECGWCGSLPAAKRAKLDRDAELVRLKRQGLTSPVIGQLLGIDPSAVRKHLRRIESTRELERVAA